MRKVKSCEWQTKKEYAIYFTGEETKKKESQGTFPKIKDQVSIQTRSKVPMFRKLLEPSTTVIISYVSQPALHSLTHSFIHSSCIQVWLLTEIS